MRFRHQKNLHRAGFFKMLLRRHAPAAWDMEEPEKNREWGNLVHLAMSIINRADQVGTVLQEFATQWPYQFRTAG